MEAFNIEFQQRLGNVLWDSEGIHLQLNVK